MSWSSRTRASLCLGLWDPGYCLPGSPSPVTPGSGAHMPALNSPSVSPTILITIPFGQAKKTASTALVLIKKSELAILADFLGPFRPGRPLTILLLEKQMPPSSFLIQWTRDTLPPTPNSEFVSSITNASAPSNQFSLGHSDMQGRGTTMFP